MSPRLPLPHSSLIGRLAVLVAGLVVAGCATQTPAPAPAASDDELKQILTGFAHQATTARKQLAAAKLNQEQIKQADPRGGNAAFDVDFIGPVETIIQAVATKAGWKFRVLGKKRDDVIVTLYHVRVPPVAILQDAGEQCSSRCDVHVEIVPNGVSEVTLTFR